jgi:hypothetical protein
MELGVEIVTDSEGKRSIAEETIDSKYRIDSINGLKKISKFKDYTVEEFEELIAEIRDIIFTTADKSELSKKLGKLLGISDIYCTFGIKSKANTTELSAWERWAERNPRLWRFFKSAAEKLHFNKSKDVKSDNL